MSSVPAHSPPSSLAPISLAALGLAALALAGCSPASSKTESSGPRAVLVQPVHFTHEAGERTFVASIRPRIEADLGFRVSGKVASRNVETGQVVHVGDVLGTLDPTDFRLQLEQAEAELAASATALDQTSADEARAAQLRKSGWASQATYDQRKTAAEEARGRHARADRAVELARNALDYASLRADADGVVTATMVEPGQVETAGQAAFRIARLAEKEAAVALPETFIEQARTGTARLTLWSQPGKTWATHLRELSPAADAATRTYAARFSIPEADDTVALGMSATLTIGVPNDHPIARVPLAALFDQGRGTVLWVVDAQNHVAPHPVHILRYDSREALVSDGVVEGDRIVTLGVQKLEAGQVVRPITQLAF